MQNVRLWTSLGLALPSKTSVPRRRVKHSRRSAAIAIQRAVRACEHQALAQARSNVAVGKQLTATLAALVVHDGTHAFVVSGATASSPWSFPATTVAVGATTFDTAVQAFDKYAGPAARKGPADPSGSEHARTDEETGWQLLPRLAQSMREGLAASTPLGHYGPTTVFFSCYVPKLSDHASSIYASRDDFNGFRLTPTEMRRHPHAGIVTLTTVFERLATADVAALKAALALGAASSPLAGVSSGTAVSKYAVSLDGPSSNRTFIASTAQKFERLIDEYKEVQNAAVCLQGRPLTISDLLGYTNGGLDSLAAEVHSELDKTYSDACHSGHERIVAPEDIGSSPLGGEPSCHSGSPLNEEPLTPRYLTGETPLEMGDLPLPQVPQPPPDSAAAAGTPDPFKMPRLADIVDAQRQHPATAAYFAFHISGALPADLTSQERREFKTEVALTCIDPEDGSLRRVIRAVGSKGPLVLPPQFRTHAFRECHDRQGHVGVSKAWAILRRLYWWPNARLDLRMYIRLCAVCRRMKVPRHKAGQGHVVNNGSSPWSYVTCDVYDVGWESGGFTK